MCLVLEPSEGEQEVCLAWLENLVYLKSPWSDGGLLA